MSVHLGPTHVNQPSRWRQASVPGAGSLIDSTSVQRPDIYMYRRRLPHWRLAGATYFVTWRLAVDQSELTAVERSLVADCLRHFDHKRHELLAYVIMDDHVNALVTPLGDWALEQVIHSWKSFSTYQLQRTCGRIGHVWQSEYFDRVIRDQAELVEKATYIVHNPWKRWPDLLEYPWMGTCE